MLDINQIRQNAEEIRQALLKRMDNVDFSELLSQDEEYRQLTHKVEELKARRNKVSKEIPKKKKAGEDVAPLIAEMKEVGDTIKSMDNERTTIQACIKAFLESLPNIPAEDVVAGGKENNEVLRVIGEKPEFSFKAKDHMELATSLGLIDYERGVKLGGAGFWLYRGMGAVLEWALLQYFVTSHLRDGFELVLPPHILNWESGVAAGQFPKFVDDVFVLRQSEGAEEEQTQFLLPTAETALINLYRDEILNEEELPLKMCAYTPCYRKEAGSYRASERGMIRGHQFNKVEMFIYCKPEDSTKYLEELTEKAESLVRDFGTPLPSFQTCRRRLFGFNGQDPRYRNLDPEYERIQRNQLGIERP